MYFIWLLSNFETKLLFYNKKIEYQTINSGY